MYGENRECVHGDLKIAVNKGESVERNALMNKNMYEYFKNNGFRGKWANLKTTGCSKCRNLKVEVEKCGNLSLMEYSYLSREA